MIGYFKRLRDGMREIGSLKFFMGQDGINTGTSRYLAGYTTRNPYIPISAFLLVSFVLGSRGSHFYCIPFMLIFVDLEIAVKASTANS